MPSLPAVNRETQTTPSPSPPKKEHRSTDTQELEEINRNKGWKHQGVDTWDLTLVKRGLNIAIQTDWERVGKDQRPVVEAGVGDIKGARDEIPGGWEMIWVQDPCTNKWEQVQVPHEETEKRRRQGVPQRPSYWGESETKA